MKRLLSLLLLLLLLVGCDSTDSSADGSASGSARMRVLMTDSPIDDFESAFVTVTRVELRGKPANEENDPGQPSQPERTYVLSQTAFEVDLLTLRDGVTTTLAELDVPAGTYSEMRFALAPEARVRYSDGRTVTLRSASTATFKVRNVPRFTLKPGEDAVLLVDFDLEDSFVKESSGNYRFQPVLRLEDADIAGVDLGERNTIQATGRVDAAGSGTVTVEGVRFQLTDSTDRRGTFTVGGYASVEGYRAEGGVLLATTAEEQSGDLDEEEREVEAEGPLELSSLTSVSLVGLQFNLTATTQFTGGLSAASLRSGTRLSITGTQQAGRLVASRVAIDAESN